MIPFSQKAKQSEFWDILTWGHRTWSHGLPIKINKNILTLQALFPTLLPCCHSHYISNCEFLLPESVAFCYPKLSFSLQGLHPFFSGCPGSYTSVEHQCECETIFPLPLKPMAKLNFPPKTLACCKWTWIKFGTKLNASCPFFSLLLALSFLRYLPGVDFRLQTFWAGTHFDTIILQSSIHNDSLLHMHTCIHKYIHTK